MSLEHTLIIRPSFTVLSGAAIGLVAGAAFYSAVSSAATPTAKTAEAVVAAAPAAVAHCAHGQKLEDGVCVIHVVRTVVVPAPAAAQAPTSAGAPGAALDASKSATIEETTNAPDAATKAAEDATKAGEGADSETEDAQGSTEGSALDDSADQAANDDSSVAAH
jgi:hypothetical protein